MRKNTYIALLIPIIIFIFVAISTANEDAGTVVEKVEDPEGVGIVIDKADGNQGIDRCKYCGRFIKNGNIHRDALLIAGRQLEEGLSSRKIKFSGGKERDQYINVYIFRFEERKGGNYSVEKPAGVGFHMHLYENGTLKRIFVFDEDQQALTANVFGIGKFFKRGGKWITAEKLFEEGIEKGLDAFAEDLPRGIEKGSDAPVVTGDVPR
jgi:hypothetical protein